MHILYTKHTLNSSLKALKVKKGQSDFS